jgi:hypothetical protein
MSSFKVWFFVGVLGIEKWFDVNVLAFQAELRWRYFGLFGQLFWLLFQNLGLSGHPVDYISDLFDNKLFQFKYGYIKESNLVPLLSSSLLFSVFAVTNVIKTLFTIRSNKLECLYTATDLAYSNLCIRLGFLWVVLRSVM